MTIDLTLLNYESELCKGDLAAQIEYAKELKVEPIVMVSTEENAKYAISSGAKALCMHNLEESELIELKKNLPSGFKESPLMCPHIISLYEVNALTSMAFYPVQKRTYAILLDCGLSLNFRCMQKLMPHGCYETMAFQ